MAEWLRRWTLNLMRTLRAGSIPGTGDYFYDDACGAANVGASISLKLLIMYHVDNCWSIVCKL